MIYDNIDQFLSLTAWRHSNFGVFILGFSILINRENIKVMTEDILYSNYK